MRHEIGSFFETADNKIEMPMHDNPIQWLQKQFTNWKIEYVCSGREAIEAAVIDIEKRESFTHKVCMLPMYTCDTVIIPFLRHGWTIYFYPINKDLKINYSLFEDLIEKCNPKVLLMHTYYGCDTIGNVRTLIEEKQNNSKMVFIEDMTQSLDILDYEKTADYYVGSLRKWFPIADGAFIASKEEILVDLQKERTLFVEKKVLAQKLKYEYLNSKQNIKKDVFLTINRKAEDCLYQYQGVSKMSDVSRRKLEQLDCEKSFHIRNENATFLSEYIKSSKFINPILNIDKESPLYFPIYVKERNQLQKYLIANDVFAPILWPIPVELGEIDNEDVIYIFRHLLAIPCDQRYTIPDMKRICGVIHEFVRRY